MTVTISWLLSAGAGASAGSPDDWSPSCQELVVQQDSGVPEEFHVFLLQLSITDPILPKGRTCLAAPPSSLVLPCRMHKKTTTAQAEESSQRKMQYSFFIWGGQGLLQAPPSGGEQVGTLEQPPYRKGQAWVSSESDKDLNITAPICL